MSHPLDEAGAKLARARTHLEELDREVAAFADRHPYMVEPDFDSEPGVIVIRAKALTPDEPVPLAVSVIVGDVLHNLRCALEYLAWQLAITGRGPDNNTHFPLCESPAQWQDWGRTYVKRMRPEHADVIQRLQPFIYGRSAGLLRLARLNNIDKHSLVASTVWGARFRPPAFIGGVLRMRIEHKGDVPMYDGAPLFRIVELEPIPGEKVQVNMPVPYTVVFSKASATDDTAMSKLDLRRAERHIRLILRVFRDVF